jgi:TIR domain/FHA domain/NB-ARC domain
VGTEYVQDEQDLRKDFFINYAPADSHWAEWIAWHLERHNYSVTLSKWDFLPGSNSILELDKALTYTDRTIVILSSHYVNVIHTLPDWTVTFKRDASGEQKRLLPIQVQQVELEGLFSIIMPINLVGQDEETALERLLEGIRTGRAKPSKSPRFPGKKPQIFGLQLKNNPTFAGRESIIASVHTALQAGIVVALSNTLVTSNASVGKTEVAKEYLYRYQSDYTMVLWIQDNPLEPSQITIFQSIRGIIQEMELSKDEIHDGTQALLILHDWLVNNTDWLLILDGVKEVQTIKALLPTKRKGYVLLTTRDRTIASIAQLVELDDRTSEEKVASEKLANLVDIALHSPNGEQLHLGLGDTTIGRASDNVIVKDDPSVSLYHAVLTLKDGVYHIRDRKGSYGTFVNRQRLNPEIPHPLHRGDTIQIGNILLAYAPDTTQVSFSAPIDIHQGQEPAFSPSLPRIIDPQMMLQQVQQGIVPDTWRVFRSEKDSFENFRQLAIQIDIARDRAYILLPFLTITSILLLITLAGGNSIGATFVLLLALFFEVLAVAIFVVLMLDTIEVSPEIVMEQPFPEALLLLTTNGFIEYIDEQHQIDAVSFADLASVQLFTNDDHSILVDLSYLDGRTGQWSQRAHFASQVYIAQQILDAFIHYYKTRH